jgi:polyisoprenoid-binding protein YceI
MAAGERNMSEMRIVLLTMMLFPAGLAARTYWYDVDYSHSQITFLAKSRIVNANGIFRKWVFKGKITDKLHVVGDIVIDCASIDTDNERRDKHLMSPDFFDCARYPEHIFRIRTIKGDKADALKAARFEVEGELTIHGTTQRIVFTMNREGEDAKLILTGSVLIDREKFGVVYNSALNPIEKEIRIDIKLMLPRRADKPPHGT